MAGLDTAISKRKALGYGQIQRVSVKHSLNGIVESPMVERVKVVLSC